MFRIFLADTHHLKLIFRSVCIQFVLLGGQLSLVSGLSILSQRLVPTDSFDSKAGSNIPFFREVNFAWALFWICSFLLQMSNLGNRKQTIPYAECLAKQSHFLLRLSVKVHHSRQPRILLQPIK